MGKTRYLSLFVFLVIGLLLVGCSKPKPLKAPTISLNEAVLSWEEIDRAIKYQIIVNDNQFETTSLEVNLSEYTATNYEIKVKAISDGKRHLDSEYSNTITVVVNNQVVIEKTTTANNKSMYNAYVQSTKDVLGFVINLKYDDDKININNDDISWTTLLPEEWIYDINIDDGNIRIAVTGLKPINVRFLQSLLKLNFSIVDQSGNVTVENFIIDNVE